MKKTDNTISIRLSNEQLKAIDEQAKIRGLSRSAYIIDCTLNVGSNVLNTQVVYDGNNFLTMPQPCQNSCQSETAVPSYAKGVPFLPLQFILSFPSDVYCGGEYSITPDEAELIAELICLYAFCDYRVMYGVHYNKSYMYIHFIIHPINLCDGSILEFNYEEQCRLFNMVQLVLNQPHICDSRYPITLDHLIRYK